MSFTVEVAKTCEERNVCYRLRHIVFVEEQGVPIEMEIDDHDESDALHFLGQLASKPIAASRIILDGPTAKIGRLVVLQEDRGRGFGVVMMEAMIEYVKANNLANQIVLDAQTQALPFYENLGFSQQGKEFLDAGIPHQRMMKSL